MLCCWICKLLRDIIIIPTPVAQGTRGLDGRAFFAQNDFSCYIPSERLCVFHVLTPFLFRMDWWTSGRRVSAESLLFYWEGDGKQIESYFYWHNDSIPADLDKTYILYNYNGTLLPWQLPSMVTHFLSVQWQHAWWSRFALLRLMIACCSGELFLVTVHVSCVLGRAAEIEAAL